MNQIKQILCKKLNDYEKMKVKVDKSLKKAPKGSLVLSSSHGMVQYYFKDEGNKKKRTYIDKTQTELVAALAQKEYDIALQKEIAKQEQQIASFRKKWNCLRTKLNCNIRIRKCAVGCRCIRRNAGGVCAIKIKNEPLIMKDSFMNNFN